MADDSITSIIRDWVKNKFSSLDSIPKDANERNNLFREYCKTDKKLDAKKHIGIFYSQLETHIKENLKGSPTDFVKKWTKKPAIAEKKPGSFPLKSTVSLSPKSPETPTAQPGAQAATQSATTAQTQDKTTATPQIISPEMQKQRMKMCAYPIKALVTLMRMNNPEIPDLTEDQELAVGEAYYPILAPYLDNGKLLQYIFAGSVTVAILGPRVTQYRELSAKKKIQKEQEKKMLPKKQEQPKEEVQQEEEKEPEPEKKTSPSLFPNTSKPQPSAREKDADVKALAEKYHMDEEKVREIFKDEK